MTATWQPRRDALLAYTDDRISVYDDGTWVGKQAGQWTIPDEAVIYGDHVGDVHMTTKWHRHKSSIAVAPDGTRYDIRLLAQGGTP